MKTKDIDITGEELRNLLEDYRYDPEDIFTEESYRTILVKKAMQSLDVSERIILLLYTELQSERKVATKLNISRSTARKAILQAKNKVKLLMGVDNVIY